MQTKSELAWACSKSLVTWLIVCGVWGVVGFVLGPTAGALFLALIVFACGTLVSLVRILGGVKLTAIVMALLSAATSFSLAVLLVKGPLPTPALVFIAIYVFVPSVIAAGLVSRTLRRSSRQPTA